MDASTNLAKIHYRMPVFLNERTKTLWLDPDVPFKSCFKEIMTSKVYEGLSFYEVGELVNSVKYDNPEVILPRAEFEEKSYQKGLGRFFTKVTQQQPLLTPTDASQLS
jgi:putative SOS response-associated peptidase YedK